MWMEPRSERDGECERWRHELKHWTCRILICLILGVVTTVGVACDAKADSRYGSQAAEMKELQSAIHYFYHGTGAYPVTDSTGTWYEKLLADNYIAPSRSTVATPSGLVPADLNGFPVVYRPPDDPKKLGALIRCVGPNGVDDGGTLDDWDVEKEPNLGYWYKWNWPALYRRAGQCAIGVVIAIGLIVWRIRPKVLAASCAMLAFGGAAAIILPWGFDGGLGRVSDSHIPYWLDYVALLGLLSIFAGFVAGGVVAVRAMQRRTLRKKRGLCPMCGYDLRGDLDAGCPECGWNRIEDLPPGEAGG